MLCTHLAEILVSWVTRVAATRNRRPLARYPARLGDLSLCHVPGLAQQPLLLKALPPALLYTHTPCNRRGPIGRLGSCVFQVSYVQPDRHRITGITSSPTITACTIKGGSIILLQGYTARMVGWFVSPSPARSAASHACHLDCQTMCFRICCCVCVICVCRCVCGCMFLCMFVSVCVSVCFCVCTCLSVWRHSRRLSIHPMRYRYADPAVACQRRCE